MLRSLPGVEQVLQSDAAASWLDRLPRARVVELVRHAIDEVRAAVLDDRPLTDSGPVPAVEAKVSAAVESLGRSSLQPVINASGVILHTNLGRAPLGAAAAQAIAAVAGRYCNLEYDIGAGKRGKRDVHCGALLETLLGTPALVVNNNAAAIFLVLHELARDGEVLVSRGELVEIGDGFRIADILEASQARLREIGSTNRTHLGDYRRAINAQTRALLRIHPSNFKQVGFTGRPALAELVELARSASIPLVEDLGSGCLAEAGWVGLEGEPPVVDSIKLGVDLVTFSGDKLLGGPQAGIIAGQPGLIARIRRNPLFRALRVDKLTLAALGETLRAYVCGREDEIPVLRLMRLPVEEIAARAEQLVRRLARAGVGHAEVVTGESLLGGGSTPMQSMPTALVAISGRAGLTAATIESRLRRHTPPVVARIEKNQLLLDLRTVSENEEGELLAAMVEATQARGSE